MKTPTAQTEQRETCGCNGELHMDCSPQFRKTPTPDADARAVVVGAEVCPLGWTNACAFVRRNANDALLRQARDLLEKCLGAFERNDCIDWDELPTIIAAIDAHLGGE